MPTSSQSQILSVVDYQLLHQQQQASGQDGTTKPTVRISANQSSITESKRRQYQEDRRPSVGNYDNQSPPPPNIISRRRSSGRITDGPASSRTTQRTDHLHLPIINLNDTGYNEPRTLIQSSGYRRGSLNDDDDDEQIETDYKLKQIKNYSTAANMDDNNSSLSDFEYNNDDIKRERRLSLLNDNARRLLILGTIRPSKTFYKDLPEADVEHLMEYFRRMRNINRKMTSEEINQELKTKFTEYKPKIFFDSSCVTKNQVRNIEKIIEQYAERIRNQQAELIKLDNPMRFVIKQFDNDLPLTTIPREYNDCVLALINRTDPLYKSDLLTELIQEKFLEDIKTNSLDISYFPGGINYDVPHDEIDETGQMEIETYQKLKKRLNNRKVWHFSGPPEKKPNALIAILPTDSAINIDHQRLLDCLYDRLKTFPTNENFDIKQRILSMEFVPLSCILNSYDISNQFIIDCDTNETKKQLIEKPLKMSSNKHSITIDLHSYDEYIHREYETYIKSEKYRELIKNHDEAIKRKSSTK